MSIWQRLRYILAIIAQVVSMLWLLMAVYFIVKYYIDVENDLRHEYWFAVWLGIIYSTGFSLGSALLASTVKAAVPKMAFRLLTFPALIIGLSLLVLFFGSVAYELASRT